MRLSKERLKEIIRQEILNSELNEGVATTIDTSDGVQVDKAADLAMDRVPALTRAIMRVNNTNELSDLFEVIISKWMEMTNTPSEDGIRMTRTAAINAISQMSKPKQDRQ